MNRSVNTAALGLSAVLASLPSLADVGPSLSVNVGKDRHAISPFIYGMAYPDAALAKETKLPINRWGGDGTSRYNWRVDGTNAGDDWYFMAGGSDRPVASAGPDTLIQTSKSIGGTVLMTVPIIDYINRATSIDSTFPVSIFGPQQKINPYVHPVVDGKRTDAGNGRHPDGTPITLTESQILRVHVRNTPATQGDWVRHMVSRFGNAAHGGVPIYELDNEPDGWNNTHRDIHPGATGDDELVKKSQAYAAAIKSADPTAAVLGPGGFLLHYQNEGAKGDGKTEHAGLGQADYYLRQMSSYEKAHGKRILDYFDEHYYPLEQTGQTDAVRLESTRSLWDPTYVENDWYGKYKGAIDLIPSFHRWVDTQYPGTKVSISEYGWGDMTNLVGALCLTDVLGIFAREKLDLACLFGPPKATEAGANAFRIYRNYDGNGGTFGDTWVRSTSEDQGKLSVYGSVRTKDHVVTIVVVNKSETELTSKLALTGFQPSPNVELYRFDADNLKAVVRQQGIHTTGSGFSTTYPARSATMFVLHRAK